MGIMTFLFLTKDPITVVSGLLLAEAVGFEPTSPCGLPDFESGPL